MSGTLPFKQETALDEQPSGSNVAERRQLQLRQAWEAMAQYNLQSDVVGSFKTPPACAHDAVRAKPYKYCGLGASTWIRIIYLQPANDNTDQLICELKPAELTAVSGSYDALSYVWGEARLTRYLHIKCDKQDDVAFLRITPNLASALRRLRSEHETRSTLR